jgi:hypothetical protein
VGDDHAGGIRYRFVAILMQQAREARVEECALFDFRVAVIVNL